MESFHSHSPQSVYAVSWSPVAARRPPVRTLENFDFKLDTNALRDKETHAWTDRLHALRGNKHSLRDTHTPYTSQPQRNHVSRFVLSSLSPHAQTSHVRDKAQKHSGNCKFPLRPLSTLCAPGLYLLLQQQRSLEHLIRRERPSKTQLTLLSTVPAARSLCDWD